MKTKNRDFYRSEEHTSELQSPKDLVCRLLLEKKNNLSSLFSSPLVFRFFLRQSAPSIFLFPNIIASSATSLSLFFFFNDTATTEIYTLSLHDALPILRPRRSRMVGKVAVEIAISRH